MIFTIHSNIKNRSTVEEYVANLCKELGISRLKRTIDIRFKKNLDEDAWGYCWGDEDSNLSSLSNKIPDSFASN